MHKNAKRLAIVGTGVAALAGTGIAFAAFTGQGSFSAAGQVHAAPVGLSAAGGQIETLYPGSCGDVTVTFANSNDHAAKIDLAHLNTASVAATLDGHASSLLVFNPNGISSADINAASATSVPAGGTADFTVHNLLCLSQSATNDVASKPVALSGQVPFVFATDSEYNG